ncbi:MAG: hypothetical protein KAS71_03165, partial [Bacteroidales bacterium]|nr:hypothetical protein [Bacteroidales bacterium]
MKNFWKIKQFYFETNYRHKKYEILSGFRLRVVFLLLFALFFTYNSSAQIYIDSEGTVSTCSDLFYDSG